MPAIAALALLDGEATPVERTFSPDGIQGNVVSYADRTTNGDVYAGNGIITLSLNKPSKTSKLTKVRMKIVMPIMDPVLTNQVSYSPTADIQFLLPQASVPLDRENLLALCVSLLSNAVATALVVTNEPVY